MHIVSTIIMVATILFSIQECEATLLQRPSSAVVERLGSAEDHVITHISPHDYPHQETFTNLDYEKVIDKQNELISMLLSAQKSQSKNEAQVDYSSWTSILLACVAIIITVLSVILAIISIVGYRNFKKNIELTVKQISSSVALSETKKQLDAVAQKELVRLLNEGALNKHMENAVNIVFLRMKDSSDNPGFNKYPEIDFVEENEQ